MPYLLSEIELSQCSSSQFCEPCRNLVYGKAWRQQFFPTLTKYGGINFSCPMGYSMQYQSNGSPFTIEQQYQFLCQLCDEINCEDRGKKTLSCPQQKWHESIDIVYPYYADDAENSEELRFSLRSLSLIQEKVKVWLIGDKPAWINDEKINYIAHSRTQNNRYIDSSTKLKIAAEHREMGNSFLYMNDDLYFVKPVSAYFVGHPRFTADYTANIEQFEIRGQWQQLNKNAFIKLSDRGFSCRDYSIHFSYLFDKENFLSMYDEYQLANTAYNCETLYYNLFAKKALVYANELCRIQVKNLNSQMLKDIDRALILNNAKNSFDTILDFLRGKFPEPSQFEK